MNLFGTKRCDQGGEHRFESHLVKVESPSPAQLSSAPIADWGNGVWLSVALDALSSKEYQVVCRWCGKKAQ